MWEGGKEADVSLLGRQYIVVKISPWDIGPPVEVED